MRQRERAKPRWGRRSGLQSDDEFVCNHNAINSRPRGLRRKQFIASPALLPFGARKRRAFGRASQAAGRKTRTSAFRLKSLRLARGRLFVPAGWPELRHAAGE